MILSHGKAIMIESCSLNWLYSHGICQMMPLNVWPNHQSICMPQLQSLCSATLVPTNVLPWRNDGLGKPCAVDRALAPTRDLKQRPPGPQSRVVNHYTTAAHWMARNFLTSGDFPDDATESVIEHSFLGCNHQSTCMAQLQPLCSAALVDCRGIVVLSIEFGIC